MRERRGEPPFLVCRRASFLALALTLAGRGSVFRLWRAFTRELEAFGWVLYELPSAHTIVQRQIDRSVSAYKNLSLEHKFGLVHCPSGDYHEHSHLGYDGVRQRMFAVVPLHDDFLHYIADTLKWIPTYNPSYTKTTRQNGFNFCGVTVMGRDGAPVAKSVFENWAILLSQGPVRLHLTGLYEFSPNGKTHRYKQLNLARRTVVRKLRILASNCEKVTRSAGDLFLWHLGI